MYTEKENAGNVVCRYIERNQSVLGLRYGHSNGKLLPITVFTQQDFMAAQRTIARRNTMFGGVYLLEIAAILFVYFKKRTHAV